MSDNLINNVDYREFVRHSGKYLKPGVYVISGRDVELRVTVEDLSDKKEIEIPGVVRASVLDGSYSCGCRRGLIKHCNKHGVA